MCDVYWKPQNFPRKVTPGGFRQCTSEQQRLLGRNCDKAECFILVPELEQMTISSFKEMRVKKGANPISGRKAYDAASK